MSKPTTFDLRPVPNNSNTLCNNDGVKRLTNIVILKHSKVNGDVRKQYAWGRFLN